MPDVTEPGATARPMRRAIAAVAVGNALEVYDFIIFAFLAVQIGKAFFPSHSAYASLMGSLATFAIGFVGRPFGAFWLGRYADQHGRKPALLLTMTLMGVGLAGVALTPGYATIGMAAPVIVVVARLLQGLAMGGEIGISTSYLIELAQEEQRGRVTSLQGGSQLVSNIAATLIGFAVSAALGPAALGAWGWRVVLGMGLLILPFSLIMRASLPETHGARAPARDPSAEQAAPCANSALRVTVLGLMIVGSGTIGTYIASYTATFAQASLHLSSTVGLGASLCGALASLVGLIIGGWLTDRFPRKPTMLLGYGASLLLTVPLFQWIVAAPGFTSLATSSALLGLAGALGFAGANLTIAESLPQARRARQFGLIYAVPVAVLGGSTQLVLTWLLHVTGTPMAVAGLRVASVALGLLAVALLREGAPRPARQPAFA